MGKYKRPRAQDIKEIPGMAGRQSQMECYSELNAFMECLGVRPPPLDAPAPLCSFFALRPRELTAASAVCDSRNLTLRWTASAPRSRRR
jgi:hypothetical protein